MITHYQNLNVPREHCEIVMYTGDVPVNVAMYRLVKEKLSEYYMLTLCPARKIELAISDAFKESTLNNTCSQNYVNIYCLFRRANLRWWLFKSQAVFEDIKHVRFNRPEGTKWVEHQRNVFKFSPSWFSRAYWCL